MKNFAHMNCKAHPLRAALYNELHIRPFHIIATPQQISYLAFRARKQEQDQAFELLGELCRRYNIHLPDSKSTSFAESVATMRVACFREMVLAASGKRISQSSLWGAL